MKLNVVLLCLGGCALVLLFAIGAFLLINLAILPRSEPAVSSAVDNMLDAMMSDTFQDTFSSITTARFQDSVTPEQYEAMGKGIRERLGSLEQKSLVSLSMRGIGSSSRIDVKYRAKFAKGAGTITATLKDESGQLLFDSFYVSSSDRNVPPATGSN